MKILIIGFIALSAIVITACNNDNNTSAKDNMTEMKEDTTGGAAATADPGVKEITPSFANIDAATAEYIKDIVDHYLHIKNALANDGESDAASGAKMLTGNVAKVDKSFFTPDQKMIYDQNEEGLKQHAEWIGKSKISQQREHFVMLSENIYNLVKAFGGGRTLYNDHCPMANKGNGALWISETADIKNPFMGSRMPTCGTVEEKIK